MTLDNNPPPPSPEEPVTVEPLFHHHKNFWERIRSYFLTGILFIAPLGLTIAITWWFISKIDQWVTPLIPEKYNPSTYLPFDLPGLGLIISFIGITLIGALTRGIAGRYFVHTSENILRRMPFVRNIYSAFKQITETIVSNQSKAFKHVVLIEYPRPNCWGIGFITGDTAQEVQEKTAQLVVNVFVPTTPNPTSGFLLLVPKKDVIYLDMSVEDGLKIVISGGIITPHEKYTKFSGRKKNSSTLSPADKGVE